MKNKINQALIFYGIDCIVLDPIQGLFYTDYQIELLKPIKYNKLLSIQNDISLYCKCNITFFTCDFTIYARVENKNRPIIYFNNVYEKMENYPNYKLPFIVGVDDKNQLIIDDLTKTPHLLIAGTTGSGKSCFLHTLIQSMLYNKAALCMIDCKRVELTQYNGINNLLRDVSTDPKQANILLRDLVFEMENRYKKMQELGIRDFTQLKKHNYNYIVCIIDELADLLCSDKNIKKSILNNILRIAQKGRACGIHLVVSTQRPDASVISGTIKANIPSSICFSVKNSIDSRVVLGVSGAENLRGNGDGLYSLIGSKEIKRIQSTFISDEKLKESIQYTKTH